MKVRTSVVVALSAEDFAHFLELYKYKCLTRMGVSKSTMNPQFTAVNTKLQVLPFVQYHVTVKTSYAKMLLTKSARGPAF